MVNRRSLTEPSSNSLCTGSCQPSVQDHPNMFKLVQLGPHSTGTPLGYVQTCSLRNTYSRQVSGWHPPQSQIQDFFMGVGWGANSQSGIILQILGRKLHENEKKDLEGRGISLAPHWIRHCFWNAFFFFFLNSKEFYASSC